ncbi:hypothetical protein [Burkholderia pseudomallei]|uniref:hypothetical protein n=1 Tax=Burkholderia pseudomallei TaxID=28450 RepID=UPI0013779F4C|nr:hypothetical protein [Burkholderia pseudomallei]
MGGGRWRARHGAGSRMSRAGRRTCEWSVGVADLHEEGIKRIGYARPSIATRPPNPMPPDPGSARFGERAF